MPAGWAVALALLALALKLALLLTSQSAPDGDEAIIGLMALHVTHGSHPLFLYGQNYDAGAGVLAHAAGVVFSVAGASGMALKAVALVVWLALVAAATLALRRAAGTTSARSAALLLLFCPTTVEWAMKARGGHMLAALAIVIALACAWGALERQTAHGGGGSVVLFGLSAAAAPWLHPSVLPAALALTGGVVVALGAQRRLKALLVIAVIQAAVTLPATFLAHDPAWSPAHFVGLGVPFEPGRFFLTVLPALFTPDLDWSIPPAPSAIVAVGWLWLMASILSLAWLSAQCARQRGSVPQGLLILTALAVLTIGIAVDFHFAGPYPLLAFYPLACLVMGLAAGPCAALHPRQARLVLALLLLSGVGVHVAALGGATVHGAGEQQRRFPAAWVTEMLADLEQHQVTCVFSESPMLPWNLMFQSRERVAARWLTARDRWQPYVDRVNAAFNRGERCALLLRLQATTKRFRQLQTYAANHPQQVSFFGDRYALLYDPSRELIRAEFAFDDAVAEHGDGTPVLPGLWSRAAAGHLAMLPSLSCFRNFQ